jgi:hypothetical protein
MTSQAGMISARTKAVLAAAKRHGVKLGGEALQAQEGGMYSKVEVKRLVDREVTREGS